MAQENDSIRLVYYISKFEVVYLFKSYGFII